MNEYESLEYYLSISIRIIIFIFVPGHTIYNFFLNVTSTTSICVTLQIQSMSITSNRDIGN